MTFGELLRAAYSADPITCGAAIGAIAVVVLSIPFRRDRVDTGYIIQVFGFFATIATVPKILYWAAERMMALPNASSTSNLSGTDLLLASGALIAIVWSAMQGLVAAFAGTKKTKSSLAAQWWQALTRRPAVWLREKFAQPIQETPEAAAERGKQLKEPTQEPKADEKTRVREHSPNAEADAKKKSCGSGGKEKSRGGARDPRTGGRRSASAAAAREKIGRACAHDECSTISSRTSASAPNGPEQSHIIWSERRRLLQR